MLLRKLVQKENRKKKKKGPCIYTGKLISVAIFSCPVLTPNTLG